MRKLILSMMVSVDGYIEGPDGTLSGHHWDEEMAEYMMQVFDTVDEFVYGRKAYELMIEHWPNENDAFAQIMNERKKYVLSNTLEHLTWNAERLTNPVGQLKAIKAQPGKDMIYFAGAEAAQFLMKEGLIDEYRLIVNPVVQGGGKKLFDTGFAQNLRLIQTRAFNCGNVLMHYASDR